MMAATLRDMEPAGKAAPASPAPLAGWETRVARVAAIAGEHADAVDRDARFPAEAIAAMREEQLLGAWIPRSLGGLGASLDEITWACEELGQRCASTAMIFAMHQIQIATLVRHHRGALDGRLAAIAREQRLIASATSEMGVGGDLRSSRCAVARTDAGLALRKQAPVISYGLEADDILATARRAEDAPSGDQVIVLLARDDYSLAQASTWQALGFRGTCSHGFVLDARVDENAVLPDAFAVVATETMVPVSHLLWSSVWLGLAVDAVRRARAFVREDAKRTRTSTGNARLAELVARLHAMRGMVHDEVREYERRLADPDTLSAMSYAIRVNNLKVGASEALVDIVQGAMRVAGISGYRMDSPFSLGRARRDAFGAVVMINNDRILAANAGMLLASRED
jgi:acyl-CoA dehydrogenase